MPGRRIPQRSPLTQPIGNMVTVMNRLSSQVYEVYGGGRLSMSELAFYSGGRELSPGEKVRAVWHEDQRIWQIAGIGIGIDTGDPANLFPALIIVASGDDGHWIYQTDSAFDATAVFINLSSSFGLDNSAFFRFINVPLAQGETVPPLRLRFVNFNSDDGLFPPPQGVLVACEDADNAAAPTTALQASAAWDNRTSKVIVWDAPIWGKGIMYTVDLSASIQEVVDRGGWVSGNAILILLYGEDIVPAVAAIAPKSYDESVTDAAQLQTFNLPVSPTDPGTVALTFYISGSLSVGSHPQRLHVPFKGKISAITATVGTAPTGADLIVDVNLGGTTIFTTQDNRPTIPATEQDDLASTPDTTVVAKDDVLTVDIDQIGSGVAGSDLVLQVLISGA